MKLSKVLITTAALIAAFAFVGCAEKDDDTEGSISGSGKNYTVSYKNETSSVYRAWNTTTFKHLGELVKITFNNQSPYTAKDGVMGFVWDLRQSNSVNGAAVTTKGYQNFFVIGFNNYHNGKPRYYISKYFNVQNLQDANFGASGSAISTHAEGIAATTPKEIQIVDFTDLETSDFAVASDGTLTFWVDIYPVFTGSTYGVKIANHSSDAVGSYVVDIYNKDPSVDTTATPVKTHVIEPSVTGYTAKPTQGTLAVYQNTQPNRSISGSWNLVKDYAEAEEIEE